MADAKHHWQEDSEPKGLVIVPGDTRTRWRHGVDIEVYDGHYHCELV